MTEQNNRIINRLHKNKFHNLRWIPECLPCRMCFNKLACMFHWRAYNNMYVVPVIRVDA